MLKSDKIGEGTFGIVYSGYSPQSGQHYAIKRNLIEFETSFIGVIRELDLLMKLRNHPNIIRLEELSFDDPFNNDCFSPLMGEERVSQKNDSVHFIFKEAVYDLHHFICNKHNGNFKLIKKYMLDILLGVEYIHSQKIIHRDLKPSNILIFPDTNISDSIAKICDFGLAKPFTYQGTQTPDLVTSWYRAPEIALGYPNYDYKIDIWAIGCIFFEMVARRPFLPDVSDDNDEILMAILSRLPEELPMRKYRELIKSNKWRSVKIKSTYKRHIRQSLTNQIGLSANGIAEFNKQAGNFILFCDLLNHMLTFDWNTRYSITDCLRHEFFKDYHTTILSIRTTYPLTYDIDYKINVKSCVERRWMATLVTDIFNRRGKLKWYSDRALFQAMDLFDRYLISMFHVIKIPKNAVESDFKGFIHDKVGTEVRFMTCLYMCIKYFSSIHYPHSFENIVENKYTSEQAKLVAEQFEGGLIKNCLEFNIYRPTVYEIADDFNDKLDESKIRDLIILYSMNDSISGMNPSQLFHYLKLIYMENLLKIY